MYIIISIIYECTLCVKCVWVYVCQNSELLTASIVSHPSVVRCDGRRPLAGGLRSSRVSGPCRTRVPDGPLH